MTEISGLFCPHHVGRRTIETCAYGGCKLVVEKPPPRRKGECFYCGGDDTLTVDHVIPKRLGRMFRRPWNTVLACEWCNRKKADMLPYDFLFVWVTKVSAQHPKQAAIRKRRRVIVAELMDRPQLRAYGLWIGGPQLVGVEGRNPE